MYYNNTEEYDFPEIEAVKKSYIICSVPRSGSTLLCRGLWDSGIAGAQKEYFNNKHMSDFYSRWNPKNNYEYVKLLKRHRTSPNGIFGFKAHFNQFSRIDKELNIVLIFPDLKYIFVSRKEHIKQAISLSKAMQTNQWSSEDKVERIPVYDYQNIKKHQHAICRQEEEWRGFFIRSKLRPLHIIYEEFVANYEKTMLAVFSYLNCKVSNDFMIPAPKLKKISDSTNRICLKDLKRINNLKKMYRSIFVQSELNQSQTHVAMIRITIIKSVINRRKI
jgi:LPS sulfotransferase NodH